MIWPFRRRREERALEERIKVLSIGLLEPDLRAPDISGPIAACERCGTSVGPLSKGPVRYSCLLTCPCGTRLEAWSE